MPLLQFIFAASYGAIIVFNFILSFLSFLNLVGDTRHIHSKSIFLVDTSSKNCTGRFWILVPTRAIQCCLDRRSFDFPLRRTDKMFVLVGIQS